VKNQKMKRKDHPPSPSTTSSSIPKKVKSPSINEASLSTTISTSSYTNDEQRERAKIWAEKLKKDNLTSIDNATREAMEAAKRKHERSSATSSTSATSSNNNESVKSTLLSTSSSTLETARLAVEAARLNRERQAAAAILRGTHTNSTTTTSTITASTQQQQQHGEECFDHDENDKLSVRSNSIADSVSSRRKSLRGKKALPPVPEEEAAQTAIILGSMHHQAPEHYHTAGLSTIGPSSHTSTTTRAKAASINTTTSISSANDSPIAVVKSSASISSSTSKKKKDATPKKTKTIVTTDHIITTGLQSTVLNSADDLSSSSTATIEHKHPALDVYHLIPLEKKNKSFISQPYLWVLLFLTGVVIGLVKYHEIDVSQMSFTDFTRDIGKYML